MAAETWALVPVGLAVVGKLIEGTIHRRTLRKTPLRIHVNGTRGKSQTTRLIAWGLQAGGVRAVGKITGDRPMLIEPNGAERAIPRRGPVSIAEQAWTVREAVKRKAEALVIECMAIHPELQRASEQRIVRSSIGVITNVRPDHLDVFGDSLVDAAKALSSTVPRQGILFTSERDHLGILEKAAHRRGSRIVQVRAERTARECHALRIHPSNLALALAVCEQAGVDRQRSLVGIMDRAQDMLSEATARQTEVGGCRITWVNAFSANDPVSTRIRLEEERASLGQERPWVGVFSHRRDRNFRLRLFAPLINESGFARTILIGDRVSRAARRGLRAIDLTGLSAERVLELLPAHLPDGAILFGFGNIAGVAADVLDLVRSRP